MLISKFSLRLMIIQVICMNFVLANPTRSQNLDEIKVSISMNRERLTKVLAEIESKTDFVFAYTETIENLDQTFTVMYNQKTSLKRILSDLSLQGALQFKRINNTISVIRVERNKVEEPVIDIVTVTGKVMDDTQTGIPGVNILLKGTTTGTTTDANGDYSLPVPDADVNGTLVFSFIGYVTVEEAIGGRTSINVSLNPDVTSLNEVVVIGYQTIEKRDLTGAVSVVNTQESRRITANTVAESIQGLAAGVTVRNTGAPGSGAKIDIRGTGTFGANEPLYVIDGMLSTATPDFNPNDIESIQILKDASAAAIYGSRAGNGVIIITTKKGKKGPMQVSGSLKTGVQEFHKRWDLMNSQQFADLNSQAYINSGLTPQTSVSTEFDPNINTDWQDAIMRTGSVQDYNVTLSGGGEGSTFLVSGNYFKNKGTIIDNSFDRANLRLNTTADRGRFKFGQFLLLSHAHTDFMEGDPFVDMIRMLPTMPIQGSRYLSGNNPEGWAIGDWTYANTFASNPVALQNLQQRDQYSYKARGNAFVEVELIEGLAYKFNTGLELSFDHFKGFRKPGVIRQGTPNVLATADQNRAVFSSFLFEHTLNYNKKFDKHSISAVVGVSNQKFNYEMLFGQKQNLPINAGNGEYFTELNQGDTPSVGSYINKWAILGYLGRVNYTYDDRYLFSATIRRDADSRFGKDYQWGTFPAISAAWRVSEESFFNINAISDLKVRASYGELGNSEILAPWQYYGGISPLPKAVFGPSETVYSGATNIRLANSDLHWETKKTTNIGIDASFLDDKITLTTEYFIAKTIDVLTELPIPLTTGNAGGDPPVNAASIQNKGFEFAATYRQREGAFKWDATLNATKIKNEVIGLGNIGVGKSYIQRGDARTEIGRAIGEWYVLKTDGIFQNQSEIDAHAIQPWSSPGDIRYANITDDDVLDIDNDRTYAGSPWPKWQTGLVFNATYGNFNFGMQWYGVFGNQLYNRPRMWMDRFYENASYREGITPWTEANRSNDTPRIGFGNADQGLSYNGLPQTDRWLESGSYVRLRNLEIGYNVPVANFSKLGIQSARLFISGQNLLTFTKYTGLDPDVAGVNIFERGLDNGQYPALRMYSIGFQLGL